MVVKDESTEVADCSLSGNQFERQADLAFVSHICHLESGPVEALQKYRVTETFLPKNCEKLKSCKM